MPYLENLFLEDMPTDLIGKVLQSLVLGIQIRLMLSHHKRSDQF